MHNFLFRYFYHYLTRYFFNALRPVKQCCVIIFSTLCLRKKTALLLTLLLSIFLLSCEKKEDSTSNNVRLGITTTLEDSGLLEHIRTAFYKDTGININAVVAGSGELFTLIEREDIGIAITHDAESEQQLLAQNIIQSRDFLFHNHFLLVGPQKNPANIQPDIALEDNFLRIMQNNSRWVSRADDSGTYKAEQRIWQNVASIASTEDIEGIEGINSHTQIINTGSGMGTSLAVAAERQAYILVDKGTWLHFNNKQQLVGLWGEHDKYSLKNPYHLLLREREPELKKTNTEILAMWLRREETQRYIASFRLQNQAVFFINTEVQPKIIE